MLLWFPHQARHKVTEIACESKGHASSNELKNHKQSYFLKRLVNIIHLKSLPSPKSLRVVK